METTFNVQRRMADWHFGRIFTWAELVVAHDGWVKGYNEQSHWAHRERPDGRRPPEEVLGWISGVRYQQEDLERAFFSTHFSSVLDPTGYVRFRNWRVYGEEALARREAALWLQAGSLTLEHAGQALARYGAAWEEDSGRLLAVTRPRLFETPFAAPRRRLFALGALGDAGWLKALGLKGYASRRPRRPQALQQALFPYVAALP